MIENLTELNCSLLQVHLAATVYVALRQNLIYEANSNHGSEVERLINTSCGHKISVSKAHSLGHLLEESLGVILIAECPLKAWLHCVVKHMCCCS